MSNFLEKFKKLILSNKLMLISFILAISIVILSVFAPYIAPYDPLEPNYTAILEGPSLQHFFGTDDLGRDIFSRILHGGRISLIVSLSSVIIGMILGVGIGFFAGYLGGRVDFWSQRLIDFLLSFPGILLAIFVSVVIGSGLFPVILAISIWSVPTFCRITRGMVMSTVQKEYVIAAKASGGGMMRIMFRHILRNIMGPILVYATLRIGSAILTTAYLSFLGVGVSPPTPEWGLLVAQGQKYIQDAMHVIFFPGMAIFITVLVFNILGDGLRDLFDVR